MHRQIIHIALWAIALELSALMPAAHAQQPTGGAVEHLRDAAYKAISPAEVSEARARANAAMARLDALLSRAGRSGATWRRYLNWQELRSALASEKPDLDVLERARNKLLGGSKGLEISQFQGLAHELGNYIRVVDSAATENAEQEFKKQRDALAAALDAYEKSHKAADFDKVDAAASALAAMGQSPDVLAELEREFSHPNLRFIADERVVSTAVSRGINDVGSVQDYILGTRIVGTRHTVGNVQGRLLPNDRQAVIDLTLFGTAYSRTVGHNGPAIIHSTGTTSLSATKRVLLNDKGFFLYPASAWANTQTCITGIGSTKGGFVGKIVQKAATKRAGEQKSEAESVASQHARSRLQADFDSTAAKSIGEANGRFQHSFRYPLMRRGAYPELLTFSTTPHALTGVARKSAEGHFAAPDAGPPVDGQHLISARVHESMINNVADDALAGRTLDRKDIEDLAIQVLGYLPERLKADEDKEPFSITFADQDPISVRFDDSGYVITFRGKGYTSGDKSYEAMNVTARYKIERANGGIHAVRQGELEIYPPGFEPGKGRLNTRQTVLKRLLEKRFGKVFEKETASTGLELKGNLARLGKLNVTGLSSEEGWLSIDWDQARSASRARTLAANE